MTEYNAAGQGGALPYGVTPDDLPQTPAERFYFAVCLADIERQGLPRDPADEQRRVAACERLATHFWPLLYYRAHGIKPGVQWDRLGWLAARYARDFTVTELADELYAVMQACDQDRRDPWTYRHAGQMAARVHRFIMREDAKVAAWMPEALAWADRVTRRARDKTAFERRARRESRS